MLQYRRGAGNTESVINSQNKPRDNVDDPDLHRQRRNVMATSIVLLVFDLADASVGEVSVLGTKLVIGNPQVVAVGAWVMWAYFLLRYYQFWRESPGFRKLLHEATRRRHTYIDRWMNRRASRLTKLRTGVQSHGKGLNLTYTLVAYEDTPRLAGGRVQNPQIANTIELQAGKIPKALVALYFARSLLAASVQTTQFTEQVLPFLVGLTPPAVAFWEWV
jgi:hypothetical protein